MRFVGNEWVQTSTKKKRIGYMFWEDLFSAGCEGQSVTSHDGFLFVLTSTENERYVRRAQWGGKEIQNSRACQMFVLTGTWTIALDMAQSQRVSNSGFKLLWESETSFFSFGRNTLARNNCALHGFSFPRYYSAVFLKR